MDQQEWRDSWGADNLVFLPTQSRPLLPADTSEFLSGYGLPRRVIFDGDGANELSFAERLMKPTNLATVEFFGVEPDLAETLGQYVAIGDFDFCNGDAFCCVNTISGAISRFDIETDEPDWFMNSGIREFGLSLLLATQWSTASRAVVADEWVGSLVALQDVLIQVDPVAFESSSFYWPALIDHMAECEPHTFIITTDLAFSKPRF